MSPRRVSLPAFQALSAAPPEATCPIDPRVVTGAPLTRDSRSKRAWKLVVALLLGALFLGAGTGGVFAFCNSSIETYAIFQCGQRGYFAPVPSPFTPSQVTGVFWQIGFGNATVSTGLGSDGTGYASSAFNGNDSGYFPVNFLDTAATFPSEGFPPGSICLGSNNWANSGVDGCCDNPRTAAPFSYTNAYSGLGPYAYISDDDALNPYVAQYQYSQGVFGQYSLASIMDYPVAILAKTPGSTWFAVAAVTNMSRGNNGVTTPSDCFSGFPANPATCDGRQGEWRFGDVTNGLPNAIPTQAGRNNVIPWQRPPVPVANATSPVDPNDPNGPQVLDLVWSAVTFHHDGRTVPSNNPTLDTWNPGQPGDPNAAPGVGVPDLRGKFGLVRYQLQVADLADTDFTTLSQVATCPSDPSCTSATSATLTLGASECVRIRTLFGVPPRTGTFSTATCRLGMCGDIGYGVNGARLCVGQCDPDPIGETCNGLDDDCDSLVDEDFLIGEPCDGIGQCGDGVVECSTLTSAICSTDPGGSAYVFVEELCNGLDDDCDGSADEPFSIGQACEGVGQCGPGVLECANPGAAICSTDPGGSASQSSAEVCDGLDNDCDGSADDGITPSPSACGLGTCASMGEVTCVAGEPVDTCTPGTPSPEICDDFDNDCDGITDEETSQCGVGACHRSGTCEGSVSTCVPGLPSPETCDFLDNDCDGATDEDFSLGAACDGVGECGTGDVECDASGSGSICSTDPGGSEDQASAELCDTLDNDCDGATDEDLNLGAACEGAGECGAGVLECPAPLQYVACGNGSGLNPAHAQSGVLCEDFDTDRNRSGEPGDFSRLPASISMSDPLLAFGDPSDDILGYTVNGGATPAGVNGQICSTDLGPNTARTCHPVPGENDWHLHSAFEGCDNTGNTASLNSYDLGNPAFAGRCAPDERAHSGFRSLHMGRHLNATDTTRDTYRFRQTSAFVMDPLILGATSSLEFWQAISVIDYRAGLGSGTTTAGGQVQMSLFNDGTGLYEPWRRLAASQNNYAVVDQESHTVCEFDPGDDRGAPLNETMCGGQPQWSHMGDIHGSNLGCLVDSDTGFEANGDCGDTGNRTVNPACQWVADPNCGSFLENGGAGTGLGRGSGVWARTTFNLQLFSGRKARFRWIFEGGGGWQFGESRSWLEPSPGGAPYQAYQWDDGWYIDDIKLTDLPTGPVGPICSTEPGGSEDQSSPESCDLLDNDCDGITDAFSPTCGVGECTRSGLCNAGAEVCTPGAPSAEVCDDLDNDCDGTTDDFTPTCGVGECVRSGSCIFGVSACTPGAPSPEICDNLDNNCDGVVDSIVVRCGVGACERTGPCVAGASQCTPGAPSAEICDNQDNDCDGSTDEVGTTCGIGACMRSGSCAGGVETCTPGVPSAEICDGLDNDCDGAVDEDGAQCGVGECRRSGTCSGGVSSCTPGQPSAEICDNLDNDCDGTTDGFGTTCGVGACLRSGSCIAGAETCTPGAPSSEICDGLDNNCDASTDEGFLLGQPCDGVGACGTGVFECLGPAASVCSTDPGGSGDQSAPEICDNLDNNCDGVTDGFGTTCGVGACRASGQCTAGVDTCSPLPPAASDDSTCNGLDDDCDGGTDEEFVPAPTVCGIGTCASAGANACQGGAIVDTCMPGAPSVEICDNLDNNCDGTTDSFSTTCGLGACARTGSCAAGVNTCSPGQPTSETCDLLDHDCDGVPANPTKSDRDGDSVDDGCDNCPDNPNPGQEDSDGDGEGNACELLVVTLSYFKGEVQGSKVVLTWATASEMDNAGFNVYRSNSPTGPWEKRNAAMIPSQGSESTGAVYTLSERRPPRARVLYYMLEDLDLSGTATRHSAIEVTVRQGR